MKVAACVTNISRIADIGSDHAHLSKYLLDNGKVSSVLNVEVRQGPYEASCKTLAAYIRLGAAKVILSYGIDDVSPAETDAVIIAGMGGGTMIDILSKNPTHTRSFQKLILQPQHAVADVRRYLIENHFEIVEEYLAKEGEKFYEIICASPANTAQFREEIFYHIPYGCLQNRCEEFLPFLKHKQAQQRKIVDSCKNNIGRRAVNKALEANKRIAEIQKLIDTIQ